jgi:maleylacetoacetate isomerase
MQYTLYSYFRSSASYRVRIALNLKKVDYVIAARHLRRGEHRTPEFLALNPQGLLPVLKLADRSFTQSLAILEYLDEIQPEPPLLPSSPPARAIVRGMAMVIACEMHPLCNLRVLQYLKEKLGQPQHSVDEWYVHWIREGFNALERMVASHGSGSYCFGDSMSLADICLVPQMHNAKRFNCDLTQYPRLRSITANLLQHPAVIAARPEIQPDAE